MTLIEIVVAGLVGVGVGGVVALLRSGTRPAPGVVRRRGIGRWLLVPASMFVALIGFAFGASIGGVAATGFPFAVLSIGVPRGLRRRRIEDRRRRRREAWPDAVQSLIGSILAGRSLHLAMIELVDEGPAALRDFWVRYQRLASTLDQAEALRIVRSEQDDPFVDRLVEVLIAALESGPAVAVEILGDLATSASEDLQFELHLASANLEQKINSRVVAIVPSAALLLLVWSNPPARDFYASGVGIVVALVGSAITGAGILVVDRLGRLDVEPRVFDGELADGPNVDDQNGRIGGGGKPRLAGGVSR